MLAHSPSPLHAWVLWALHPTQAQAVVAAWLCVWGSNKSHISEYNNNPRSSSLTSDFKKHPVSIVFLFKKKKIKPK